MDSLVRFGVAVPASLLSEFDLYIRGKGLQNRSEALRQLIRNGFRGKRGPGGTASFSAP